MEDVIRMYEELGVRESYLKGKLDLLDPVMVQALRFVSHVLNDPLAYRLPLDKGTEVEEMTRKSPVERINRGVWKNTNHLTESWSLSWQSVPVQPALEAGTPVLDRK